MEGNTNSITECLNQMITLTKKNLAILKTINDSFNTKRSHLVANIDDETYVLPSFLSLESRIESLENNLENVLNAPLTGEAFTYFDGTTQKLELAGYSTTPNPVNLSTVSKFKTESTSIFKDFMTPNPYIHIGLESIPDNIKHVLVRKICINEDATVLRETIMNNVVDGTIGFADMERILFAYTEGVDYTQYDTLRRLPIRKGTAQGTYEIKTIVDNYQDSNFDEYYELELNNDLVYYTNNGTIQHDIEVGDKLVTWNDKVMLEVTDMNLLTRTMTVKVLFGAYANLQDILSGNPDLYKLKYFDDNTRINSKYIDIPLEEDKYIVVFVAPINDTTNTCAPWGTGLYFDVDSLQIELDGQSVNFRDYYDTYVNNVGDALLGITAMMDDDEQVSRLSPGQFELVKSLMPEISQDLIKVTQINKHLNDTQSVKTIRNLYNQKSQYKLELETVQKNIDQINQSLAELSFDDTTNTRSVYENQLSEYNQRKIELVGSINSIMQEISVNANNSETPIENAKYRIRGFMPIDPKAINIDVPDYVQVIKIDVEYRYKSHTNFTGNAETFAGDDQNYIYSDWNKMVSIYRKRIPTYENNMYKYNWEPENGDTNNPSFNQFDIPITQGESVDIRVRFIYNLGYPFAELHSAWSAIYTQDFPTEFLQNVEVLDIIEENNNEIKSRRFENMLDEKGITTHVDDKIQDQTITYLHQAAHISSGFVTEERRIIPLDVKLQSFNSDIEQLKSEVFGLASSNIIVTLGDMNNTIQLKPDIVNKFRTMSYNAAKNEGNIFTIGDSEEEIALTQLMLTIFNNGSYDLKLHSMFPGAANNQLNPNNSRSRFDMHDYTGGAENEGVYMKLDVNMNTNINNDPIYYSQQVYNQFMYFRYTLQDLSPVEPGQDLYTGTQASQLFSSNDLVDIAGIPTNRMVRNENNIIELWEAFTPGTNNRLSSLYPYPSSLDDICLPQGDTFTVVAPGESIAIPLNFAYWFKDEESENPAIANDTVTRLMAFDLRPSLFQDPITYKFVVTASKNDTKGFELKKNTISGIRVSNLQKLIPSTPKTVARNSASLKRASSIVNEQNR